MPKLNKELNDATLNITLPASLKEKVVKFAKKNGVSKAQATRYMLEVFFDSSLVKSKDIIGESQG